MGRLLFVTENIYPLEDYCASNNARNLMSAPSWSDAKFGYRNGTRRLRCVMK